jgi:AcrR family transcriptional regulator
MSLANRRPKQPELVRQQLLDVTLQIVATEGAHAVTLDAVARRAQVTKGGLQHHFPSKQALLDTLFDTLFHDFEAQLQEAVAAEEDTPGRHARAYIKTVFDSAGDVARHRAVLSLGLSWAPYSARWRDACAAALQADGGDRGNANRLLLCRLAADGLWSAQMFDIYALDTTRRTELLALLLQLCDEEPA